MQEFRTLVLPPVPVPRSVNNSANHNPSSASSAGERRTSVTMSTASGGRTHSHGHGHAHNHPHHHAQHSVASEPYPTSKPSSSNKGGVRGRVTVVCAEVCIFSSRLWFIFSHYLLARSLILVLPLWRTSFGAGLVTSSLQCKRLKVRSSLDVFSYFSRPSSSFFFFSSDVAATGELSFQIAILAPHPPPNQPLVE